MVGIPGLEFYCIGFKQEVADGVENQAVLVKLHTLQLVRAVTDDHGCAGINASAAEDFQELGCFCIVIGIYVVAVDAHQHRVRLKLCLPDLRFDPEHILLVGEAFHEAAVIQLEPGAAQGQYILREGYAVAVADALFHLTIHGGYFGKGLYHCKMRLVNVVDLLNAHRIQAGSAGHIPGLVTCARCFPVAGIAGNQRHTAVPGLQVTGLGGLAQVFPCAGKDHIPRFQMANGRQHTTLAKVTGVVVGGGENIEAVGSQVIQRPGVRHSPGAAAFRSGVAFTIVEGGFQIQKPHIVRFNQGFQIGKAFISTLRKTTGNEGITSRYKSRFHPMHLHFFALCILHSRIN